VVERGLHLAGQQLPALALQLQARLLIERLGDGAERCRYAPCDQRYGNEAQQWHQDPAGKSVPLPQTSLASMAKIALFANPVPPWPNQLGPRPA
jgi:hypothetical protein